MPRKVLLLCAWLAAFAGLAGAADAPSLTTLLGEIATLEAQTSGMERRERELRLADLLLEAARTAPDDPRAGGWLDRRWTLLGHGLSPEDAAERVLADVEAVSGAGLPAGAESHADFWRSWHQARQHAGNPTAVFRAIRDFLAEHPDDPRGAELLALVADDPQAFASTRIALWHRVAARYGDTPLGALAPGRIRRIEKLGREPVDLAFEDAVARRPVSLEVLRGRVVVLHFHHAACATCELTLPRLAGLREAHADHGLEIVGVHLDAPPRDEKALREWALEHRIGWPQLADGRAFGASWGVGQAPVYFVLDRRGLLRLVAEDVGRLETMVPLLLAEPLD